MIKIKTWLKVISFIVIVLLLIAAVNMNIPSLLLNGDQEQLHNLSNNNMLLLLFFTMMLMLIQNLFTIIPLLLLVTINVTVFGFTYGYIWSWMTSVIGAMVSFLVVRYWFQDFFAQKLNNRMKQQMESKGYLFVFFSRMIPFVPTSFINTAAAVSSIHIKHFTYSTILGNMIYILVLSLIPSGIISIDYEKYAFAMILAALAVGFFIYKFVKKHKVKNSRSTFGK